MRISTSMRWLVVAVSAAMLLAVAAACSSETIEVPGETVVVKEEVIKTVEVPGETVVKEVIKEVQVPGETVVVKEEVVKEVMVPGETVVVEKEVVKTIEVPGQTVVVTKEVAGPERVVVREVPGGKDYVTDPSTGKTVEAPRYGGSLTYVTRIPDDNLVVDAWVSGGAGWIIGVVNEKLGIIDWAIDRNKHPFFTGHVAPAFALRGALAESWDISPDGLTYTFNIRKGVNWHNKAPMNGRELTAKDIEYNFHRNMGMGKFTEPSASRGALTDLGIASIEATDDMTVVFKLSGPHFQAFQFIMDWYNAYIQPPEPKSTA